MIGVWIFILVFALALMFQSYVGFPYQMLRKKKGKQTWDFSENLPKVAVLLSVYNEAQIIEKKIKSTFETTYPKDKIEFWIGSDNSDDETNQIIEKIAQNEPRIHFFPFKNRMGKPQIINILQTKTNAEILILTDADTLFLPDTISELIQPFANKKIGGVQANILIEGTKSEAVFLQELAYNSRELKIKKGESKHGAVIGAFGACYAIRNELYEPTPKNFLVDDFFIFMNVLKANYQTVFTENALTKMEISGRKKVQFKRKIRISRGNFQNLIYFKNFINPFKNFQNYAFFFHKVVRWLGPFLILLIFISNWFLFSFHAFFKTLFFLQIAFYMLAFIDLGLQKLKIKIVFLRFISHFVLMNLALLLGFFKFLFAKPKGSWSNE